MKLKKLKMETEFFELKENFILMVIHRETITEYYIMNDSYGPIYYCFGNLKTKSKNSIYINNSIKFWDTYIKDYKNLFM